MSPSQKRYFVVLPGLIGSVLLVTGLLLVAGIKSRSAEAVSIREVILKANDVVFKDANMMESNPKLFAKVGETIRIVFKNTEAGVTHALSVPKLDAKNLVVMPGKEVVLEITPKSPGEYEYICPLHSKVMKGTIVVE